MFVFYNELFLTLRKALTVVFEIQVLTQCANALFLVWCIRGVGLIPCRALFGAKNVFRMPLLFPFSVGLLGDMVGRAFRQLTPAPSFITGCFGTFRS